MNKKLLMPCLASLPIEELVGVPYMSFAPYSSTNLAVAKNF